MGGDTITATAETLQPEQSAETATANDARSPQVALAEQILAPRESVRAAAAARLAAADPKKRLVLRKHPVVPAVIISDIMTRVIAVAVIISFRLSGYSSAVSHRMNAVDLTAYLARDLARARDLGLALDLDLARGRLLARAIDLARARDFGLAIGLAIDLAFDLARVLARARDLARVLTRARALAIDLAFDRSLDLPLDRALDLAGELVWILGEQLGLQNMEGLGPALLAGALDDFSRTDLSGIDLTGIDLVGVRWSERDTRWPPGTDIERLRSASEETEPGSGVFVITRSGGTDRTGEEVRV